MGTIFAYSIGISLPLILMWAIYKTLLAHTTLHHFNRMMLLSIYATALLIIPLLQSIPSLALSDTNSIISVSDITATIAHEQEMKAKTQEMKAIVLAAESEVHKAMATAMKNGKFGVVDYYKLQNIAADTDMRKSISGARENKPAGGGKPEER